MPSPHYYRVLRPDPCMAGAPRSVGEVVDVAGWGRRPDALVSARRLARFEGEPVPAGGRLWADAEAAYRAGVEPLAEEAFPVTGEPILDREHASASAETTEAATGDVLTSVELTALAASGDAEPADLSALTRKQLAAIAEEMGLKVKGTGKSGYKTERDFIDAITAARTAQEG